MAHDHEGRLDTVTGVRTTGHEWDGIEELNNPLPRWWLYLFYVCIVWAMIYWVLMPAWPLVNGFTPGLLGYSQREQGMIAYQEVMDARTADAKGLADSSFAEIQANPTLLAFALAQGKAAFGDNCAPCHGQGATGGVGYPNLQDDDWLWGGTIQDIAHTITVGVRSTSPDTRVSDMPAFGKDGLLTPAQINEVAGFVHTLSGQEPAPGVDVAAGKQIFADNCAACHGPEGKGNPEVGAPNLTDNLWLYGGSTATIVQTVTGSRKGVMPTWEGRLSPELIKSLALYVHSLGGGKQ